jgi:hypothetical protein
VLAGALYAFDPEDLATDPMDEDIHDYSVIPDIVSSGSKRMARLQG